jgi:hypothetical protein
MEDAGNEFFPELSSNSTNYYGTSFDYTGFAIAIGAVGLIGITASVMGCLMYNGYINYSPVNYENSEYEILLRGPTL